MAYTENERQQLRDFVKEGLLRVVGYMKETMGLPEEMTIEKIHELETLGQQIAFLGTFANRHPKLFKDMPVFRPEQQ